MMMRNRVGIFLLGSFVILSLVFCSGPLPSDLSAEKFFSILENYYPDKKIIKIVKKYPVRVSREGESYVLILCVKGSRMTLYKDLGGTITHVDFPYWREGKKVPCQE